MHCVVQCIHRASSIHSTSTNHVCTPSLNTRPSMDSPMCSVPIVQIYAHLTDRHMCRASWVSACIMDAFPCNAGTLDAVFLDLPHPWDCEPWLTRALRVDQLCHVCTFSPCIEQVQRACAMLRRLHMTHIRTVEVVPRTLQRVRTHVVSPIPRSSDTAHTTNDKQTLSLRPYPAIQPTHTSYLTFATKLPYL